VQPLEKTLRNQLERTIGDARDIAEAAAHVVLEQLGVGDAAPFNHLSETERELRRKLRVHGRQLGDCLDGVKIQTMDRLVEEVAYEHWHRMLFARFLAENNLLMYPDPQDPVAVTLEECEDLAADEGASNGWELAARFAARMLPQIFRHDSPVFQLILPPEHQQKLERLVADLPKEVFTASDSLGWVYQFWQAKKKDEINASEVKIGARELSAVTQLFTEPYMVSFLLDNSLGAWWAARSLSEADLKSDSNEEELRCRAAIPGIPLDYLRFVKDKDGAWIPAAGIFDNWPDCLSQFKIIDPCCGSGHFLVAVFLMLVPMRMALEGLTAREAVDRVSAENIHGLELDQRCVELAAFALALAAWRYPDAGGYRPLPALNVACSGLSVSVAKEEWKQLALDKYNLRIALEWMHDTFKNAPVLGSLLNPAKTDAAKIVPWDELGASLVQALSQGQTDEQHEATVVAQGLAKAATLLAGKYHWVITNVPYLARGKQSDTLREFCERHYPEGKNDLATVFLDRCLELCVARASCSDREKPELEAPATSGSVSVVLPQNWLFLTSYKKFREKLLKDDTWHLIARLGPGAFETISGEVVKAILITLSRGNVARASSSGLFAKREQDVSATLIRGLDVSAPRTAAEKATALLTAEIKSVEQAKQLENPDTIVSLTKLHEGDLFGKHARSLAGLDNGDALQFRFVFWEMNKLFPGWIYQVNSADSTGLYAGREHILRWEEGRGNLVRCPGARLSNIEIWGNNGVYVSRMRDLPATLCLGSAWDRNGAMIIPKRNGDIAAIWVFCSSEEFSIEVRKLNQKISVAESTFENVPFDVDRWIKIAETSYPNGLPKPYSDGPTQWIFHGHPCGSVVWDDVTKRTVHGPLRNDAGVLQVAVARLLGYRWPAELDSAMELSDEAWACVEKSQDLLPFADEDGIVCIPPVRGEASASDRLFELLVAAYGDTWSNDTLAQLLKQADHAGKTLVTWMRDKFFLQHCKLFHHRPFIWHIWDGLRDGFAALVNYHKLDHKNLETLIYTYLGDWISRQKQDIVNKIDGAQEKLAAAEQLKKRLELILEGEAPYDIFIRWKPIEKQPIGWDPDLNDGVRLNIRPFITAQALRFNKKPQINIAWDKDRGKDVESAPWYHHFNGDRINDHHLSLVEKQAAQKAVR
jgi:hypothetical protein